MRTFKLLGVLLAAAVSACGGGGGGASGGGGETLTVTLSWSSSEAQLFKATTLSPVFSGFNGHTPSCTLTSGRVPPGMSLAQNCAITGRPTEAGSFNLGIRVSASGVSNTVDSGATVRVVGPSVFYTGHAGYLDHLAVGDTVSDLPSFGSWTAPTDTTVGWNFSVRAGALPNGLVLDPATGRISGTFTAQGAFSATIQAVLTTPYGSYETQPAVYSANVSIPSIAYVNVGGTGQSTYYQSGYVSQPFDLTASPMSTPPGSTFSNFRLVSGALPPGLTLDNATGRISGVPTQPSDRTNLDSLYFGIEASYTVGAFVGTASGRPGVEISYPAYVGYGMPSPRGTVGTPLTVIPKLTQISPIALVAPSFTYTPRAGACDLPPGVTMDGNGVASGTPTAAGSFSCMVDAVVTNNGTSWDSPSQLFIVIE